MGNAVVVGVDGSEYALTALEWACHEASVRNAQLEIVHVAGGRHPLHSFLGPAGTPIGGGGEDQVLRAAEVRCSTTGEQAARPTLTKLRPGVGRLSPVTALVEHTRTAQLLVLGARGSSGMRERLLGSTALRCAAWSTCPTVIVREGPSTVGRVMVALDDSPAGRRALWWGFHEADLHRADLHVVHVVWPPEWAGYSREQLAQAARQMVEFNLEQLPCTPSGRGVRAVTEVVEQEESAGADPGAVLIAKSSGADLVVCGSLGFASGRYFGEVVGGTTATLPDLSSRQLGSVAHHVLLRSPSHVVVVQARREDLMELRLRTDQERDWNSTAPRQRDSIVERWLP
jgi:nucleotide-binding universal stress UspA family protein